MSGASIFNTTRLEDKTVLITGSSGGIGKATAILFAKAGANLVLLARRKTELEAVKALCEAANKEAGSGKGGNVTIVECDISNRSAVDAALAADGVKEWAENVEVLVNNAGLVKGVEKVGDIADEDIDVMFSTNVIGLIHLTQKIVKSMKARQTGHVINLGSVAGREAYAGGAIYCATKHALRAFSSSLMKELVGTPIRISEVQPGMVETDFSVTRFRGDKDQANNVYKGTKPLVAEDIAEEIVWVALRPKHVQIAELFVFPSCQAGPGIVHRE
ncbi:probable nadp()-dependent dehydrogenase acting on 3-hydroxy acids [Phaffia rhodozyma]|uniref:Probable nadp( )-dependent dehydrogenase acting on 3-hydroxy acids n=1 Tax=Phaffia rhodozyma TaxID=264483 RepID=A0A0F7SUQ0_PHARH|nr:probable nadp()-dependent dehydrogenase acting on 3-hydroxy acids [Phaffia rhodozyma]